MTTAMHFLSEKFLQVPQKKLQQASLGLSYTICLFTLGKSNPKFPTTAGYKPVDNIRLSIKA